MKYVGLTDDPTTRKIQHANPADWSLRRFSSEKEVRDWERNLISQPGYQGG
jgi:hypothetical protein